MKLVMPIVIFSFCMQSILVAQTKNKLYFNNIDQVGFITANKPNSIKFETINGVRLNSWSAGIGVGIDLQTARSIPLFLDVRKCFEIKKGSWFIYADVGKNIGWQNNTNNDFFTKASPYEDTYFTEGGVGYLFKLHQKKRFFISAGYGYKSIKYTADYTYINSYYPYLSSFYPSGYNSYKIDTYINRVVIKAGVNF